MNLQSRIKFRESLFKMVDYLECDSNEENIRILNTHQRLRLVSPQTRNIPRTQISNTNDFFSTLLSKINPKSDLVLELSIYIQKIKEISEKTKQKYFEILIEGIDSHNSQRLLDLNNVFSLSIVIQKKIALKFIEKIFESEINGKNTD